MTSNEYAAKLERKLIEEFRIEFFDKLGYYPVVLSKYEQEILGEKYMSLEKLSSYFEPFLPTKYDKKITLVSKWRYRELVELRCMFCFLAKEMKYSLSTIGEFLSKRDHTTVIHNIRVFNNLMDTSDPFRDKFRTILNYIKQQQSQNPTPHESSIMESLPDLQHYTEPGVPS